MHKKPNSATTRLRQDYMKLKKDPVPYIVAEPLPSNILEWHYVVFGPENSPYSGGMYHGRLVFSREFPFKPPSIFMTTPNGRFKTNTRLCLSISDFHPDTWNPTWSVSTILIGLLSFMLETGPTLGSIETTEDHKRKLAYTSLSFNLNDRHFCELFPGLVEDIKKELEKRREAENEARRLEMAEGANRNRLGSSGPGSGGPAQDLTSSSFQSALFNLGVVVGFVAFVLAAKYVVSATPME